MTDTAFSELAALASELEAITGRRQLACVVAQFLQKLAPEEIAPAVRLIIGQVFPEGDERTLNVSWRSLISVVEELAVASPGLRKSISEQAVDGGQYVRQVLDHGRASSPVSPPLSLLEVHQVLGAIAASSGPGSRAAKADLLRGLLLRASGLEATVVTKVVLQDMRHGVNEGIMLDAIALAAGAKVRWVRRANQLWGDLGSVALAALTEGEAALKQATIAVFRPTKPMLAQTCEAIDGAFQRFGERFALEYKLDGARAQIHRSGKHVRIFSRNLAEVTRSLPDVVDQVRSGLAATQAILDGEVIAVDKAGRPLPFQHLMRRFRRRRGVEQAIEDVPVQLFLFDMLLSDGQSLLDLPAEQRWARLEGAAGRIPLVQRLAMPTHPQAEAFSTAAHEDGHEGVMAKDLDSAYGPGVRGRAWLKIKHVMSLDLVVVAADWGYGRRHGWLSNYHLAAWDPGSRAFQVVGKTFKGLTDAEFQQMTRRLVELEYTRQGSTVFVEPRIIVEVLFNEVQKSSQYPSGLALRFARIARIRTDKRPQDADTVQTVRRMFEEQLRYKGRPS